MPGSRDSPGSAEDGADAFRGAFERVEVGGLSGQADQVPAHPSQVIDPNFAFLASEVISTEEAVASFQS